jgi:nucleoside-diphosphate-sugar epimerase
MEDRRVRVGVVGANSRSGAALISYLSASEPEISWRGFVRHDPANEGAGELIRVSNYDAISVDDLAGCDALINFVGVVDAASEKEFHAVNVALPQALVAKAVDAGIAHFLQMSSLSLHGPLPFIDSEAPLRPTTAYGRSKLDAERAIASAPANMVVTLLRVPTIYGQGTESKLATLAGVMRKVPVFPAPKPLPRRSVISHANLARLLVHLLAERTGGVVYGADPEPFTLELLSQILPNRPRIASLPKAAFAPLRLLAPGIYASLYESGEIAPELLLRTAGLLSTRSSLERCFGSNG